jgi:hypothetical protein
MKKAAPFCDPRRIFNIIKRRAIRYPIERAEALSGKTVSALLSRHSCERLTPGVTETA